MEEGLAGHYFQAQLEALSQRNKLVITEVTYSSLASTCMTNMYPDTHAPYIYIYIHTYMYPYTHIHVHIYTQNSHSIGKAVT